jgi:thymidylate kinase
LPVILTNANSTKAIRKEACSIAHKAGRKVIMIYFNRPEETLLQRIDSTQRSKKCLTKSANFRELLLKRQASCFEVASKKESDIFFEITSDASWKKTQKAIVQLIKDAK